MNSKNISFFSYNLWVFGIFQHIYNPLKSLSDAILAGTRDAELYMLCFGVFIVNVLLCIDDPLQKDLRQQMFKSNEFLDA